MFMTHSNGSLSPISALRCAVSCCGFILFRHTEFDRLAMMISVACIEIHFELYAGDMPR